MAREDGVSYDAMKMRLYRRSQRAIPQDADYETRARAMPPDQAVEYLIDCIRVLTDAQSDEGIPAGLTRAQRRLFVALRSAGGKACSHEYLRSVMWFDRLPGDDYPESNTLKVQISKMRRKLPQWEIASHWGVGYSIRRKKTIQSLGLAPPVVTV